MKDDPFELLGLPHRFDLDAAELQRAYLDRSARLHPDRYADPIEQAEASEQAARVNHARAVLGDPERRANALLELLGGPACEAEKTLPDGFLLEIMSVRVEMEDALRTGDEAERARFEAWAAGERSDRLARIGALLEEAAAGRAPETLHASRVELNALRYIERMIEQLDPDHEPLG